MCDMDCQGTQVALANWDWGYKMHMLSCYTFNMGVCCILLAFTMVLTGKILLLKNF